MGPQFLVQTGRLSARRGAQPDVGEIIALSAGNKPLATRRRLEYLDAIRGLAALSVVLNHYVYSFGRPANLANYFPFGIWWDGMAGVSMFFVLSGFVLSLQYFKANAKVSKREMNYPRFITARVFRIWVPYIAVIMACVAAYRLRASEIQSNLGAGLWLTRQWAHPMRFGIILRDAFLLRIESHPTLINPSWTLSIEMVISLLLPAAITLARRSSGWLIFAALLLFQTFHVNVFILHFTGGVLLAKHASVVGSSRHRSLFLRGLLVAIPLYNIRFLKVDPAWQTNAAWIISGIGALGILAAVVASPKLQAVLSNALLSHLGRTSYGLYLVHAPVLICLTPRILHLCTSLSWYSNWVIGLASTLAISLLLAEVFYRWIEVSSIAAGKQVGQWVSRLPKSLTPGRALTQNLD